MESKGSAVNSVGPFALIIIDIVERLPSNGSWKSDPLSEAKAPRFFAGEWPASASPRAYDIFDQALLSLIVL